MSLISGQTMLLFSDAQRLLPAHVALKIQPESSGCWLWVAARDYDGYGQTHASGRQYRAHRFVWATLCGPIPDGLCVLHACDNPPCVNPYHLFLGTNADNMANRNTKGRQARGETFAAMRRRIAPRGDDHWTRQHPERRSFGVRNGTSTHPECTLRGEQHPRSKLTDSLVRAIRERVSAGMPVREAARFFGVSRSSVQFIIKRQRWAHVQ